MSLDFYDSNGTPIAYSDDGEHIYTFDGRPVAYLSQDSVYSFSGAHLGRFETAMIRDNDGEVALFTEGATGGPPKPLRQLKPLKGLKQLKPLKGIKELQPLRPLPSSSWSRLSGEKFFGEVRA